MKAEPREGRCWLVAHQWSKWELEPYTFSFQVKACLRCGRRRRRWIG